MPWYWTDDIAEYLQTQGKLSEEAVRRMATVPVGIRRDEVSIEAASAGLLEDDEIPLAA